MAGININAQDVQALARDIERHEGARTALAAAGNNEFCKLWPTAESVLNTLEEIVESIPGWGFFAKLAIGVVLSAGKAAFQALHCV
ncbi:MAG: hypothetical protein H0X25_16020 [Acidobacteriales bacterium]|nr:hypothetical protein [Terriglobales bacterium]